MTYSKVIAIDGPSGSGKSTIAQLVAKQLGHLYIDTGAMFRGIGLHLTNKNIDEGNIEAISHELSKMEFIYGASDNELIVIDGENLSSAIRQHHVSDIASRYSKVQIIRDYLMTFQRNLVSSSPCVMEGRDIGTVIFPDAYLKIFLTATDNVRALRRQRQLLEKGEEVSIDQLIKDIRERDERDSKRDIAPLAKADDACEILTDDLSIDEVIAKIIELECQYNGRLN